MTTSLLLVRHAEADWEKADETRNPPLSAQGREQARRLGQWLKASYKIDAFYSSTLTRARQTAEIINESLKLSVVYKDELQEWPQPGGVRTVLPKTDNLWGLRYSEELPKEYWDFAERIFRTLGEVVERHRDQTILIVCHGGVISTTIRTLMGGHRLAISFDHTGIGRIFWEEGLWEIDYLNRREHLL